MGRRWYPMGTLPLYRLPEVGALVAIDHAVYRVMSVEERPRDLWTPADEARFLAYGQAGAPVAVVCRPARLTGDDPALRGADRHVRACGMTPWDVYPDEHYPVCARCGDPMPCREQTAIRDARDAAEHMARYELGGVCPACLEPVTQRQGARTFKENLYVPGGPPVTFHAGRRRCWGGLVSYEDQWIGADPERRSRRYRCEGTATVHGDSGRLSTTYECTTGVACPGAQAGHRAYVGCHCPEHDRGFHRGFRGLARDARNLALDGA